MADSIYVEGGAMDFVYCGVHVQDLRDPRRRDVRMLGQKGSSIQVILRADDRRTAQSSSIA